MEKLQSHKHIIQENSPSDNLRAREIETYNDKEMAEKINEIIDFINFVARKDGGSSYMAEFNQSRIKS
jgi:hypothetical protein